jgi:hypothetical protein
MFTHQCRAYRAADNPAKQEIGTLVERTNRHVILLQHLPDGDTPLKRSATASGSRRCGMADMRRHSRELPAGPPQIQFRRTGERDTARARAAAAPEGIDVNDIDVLSLDTLQPAMTARLKGPNDPIHSCWSGTELVITTTLLVIKRSPGATPPSPQPSSTRRRVTKQHPCTVAGCIGSALACSMTADRHRPASTRRSRSTRAATGRAPARRTHRH